MTRILVTGSRNWPYSREDLTAAWMFQYAVGQYLTERGEWAPEYGMPIGDITVVHGDCPTGLDFIAREWCILNFVRPEPHPADWDAHGKAAGPMRNTEMVSLGADVCLAFPLGESRGTRDCMTKAYDAGIPTRYVYREQEEILWKTL